MCVCVCVLVDLVKHGVLTLVSVIQCCRNDDDDDDNDDDDDDDDCFYIALFSALVQTHYARM